MKLSELDKRILVLAQKDPTINVAIHTALGNNISEREFMIMLIRVLSEIKEEVTNKMVEMHRTSVLTQIQIEGPVELIDKGEIRPEK